eukprot:TRINITY_DN67180_c9_g3_i2.p1 TRINITY_DN67180_c9_g3~~TRINITY_DN67180_c9_g3_i2.p1  ORF type:complete len:299 (+),score=9.51 TRINITY_DN67180_c9_g3_i2:69-965(+)
MSTTIQATPDLRLGKKLFLGFGSAAAIHALMYPLNQITVRQWVERSSLKEGEVGRTVAQTAKRMFKMEGIRSFYRYHIQTGRRYAWRNGLLIVLNDKVSDMMSLSAATGGHAVSGTLVSFLLKLPGYPIDTAKIGLTMDSGKRAYKGLFHWMKVAVREEGLFRLYRGFGSRIPFCILDGMLLGLFGYFKTLHPFVHQLDHLGAPAFGASFVCALIADSIRKPLAWLAQETIHSKNTNKETTSLRKNFAKVMKKHGLFRGYMKPMAFLDFVVAMRLPLVLATYDYLKLRSRTKASQLAQ